MRHGRTAATLAIGGAIALLSAVGCGQNRQNNLRSTDERPPEAVNSQGTSAEGRHVGAPMTLTGCLQKTGGIMSTYVLTLVNEPSEAVGTSGAKDPGTVAREQVREAWHSYRLNAEQEDLSRYIGKQIKVTGRLADSADMKRSGDSARAPSNEKSRSDLDAGDLARVDASNIEVVSDSCGSSPAPATGATRPTQDRPAKK
jgi:hypothetical protein